MDLKPKLTKKFIPKVPVKMCETCIHRRGDFFQDPEDGTIIRVYCKARYTNVNAEEMTKYCDHYKQRLKEV